MSQQERGEHKGENGKVLIVGGSTEYVGCLALTGLAALRTGVDLVYIAAPEKVAWTINSYSPDLITIKLPGDYINKQHIETISQFADSVDSMVIGTGAGQNRETKSVLSKLASLRLPKVIDADALKSVDATDIKNAILTPHQTEYRILFGEKPTRESILTHARPDKVIVVKGKVDLISDGMRVYENKTGNTGMTVGGTGDTLAGIIAALIAQGHTLIDAAKIGTRINGIAGDLAFEKNKFGLTASDIIEKIPEAFQREKLW